MSWGELTCKHIGKCPIPKECTWNSCNRQCRAYAPNLATIIKDAEENGWDLQTIMRKVKK